jgi:hypothetical protein
MAGVEGQRIRGTFARRGLSGRTFGAAFEPVPLAYGVLPTIAWFFGIDFAGGSRLPANFVGGDRPRAKYGAGWPTRFGHMVSWRSVDRQSRSRWAGGCLVEIAVAQTGRVNEAQPDGYGFIQGRYKQKAARLFGLIAHTTG